MPANSVTLSSIILPAFSGVFLDLSGVFLDLSADFPVFSSDFPDFSEDLSGVFPLDGVFDFDVGELERDFLGECFLGDFDFDVSWSFFSLEKA